MRRSQNVGSGRLPHFSRYQVQRRAHALAGVDRFRASLIEPSLPEQQREPRRREHAGERYCEQRLYEREPSGVLQRPADRAPSVSVALRPGHGGMIPGGGNAGRGIRRLSRVTNESIGAPLGGTARTRTVIALVPVPPAVTVRTTS